MKYLCILFFLFYGLFEVVQAQHDSFTGKAKKMIGVLSVYHVNPVVMNETTARETVELFIRDLDKEGFILKKSDVALLRQNNARFYDYINTSNEEYAVRSIRIYREALNSVDSILNVLSQKTIDFTTADTLITYPFFAEPHYSEHLPVHAKRMEKHVKYLCMNKAFGDDGSEMIKGQAYIARCSEYSKKVISDVQQKISRLQRNAEKDVESALLNAIALRHDPHTNYLTQEQNKRFSSQLSSKVESFGLYFDENENGEIIVADIVPGGSAWMSNEINEGDLFIALKTGGNHVSADGRSASEIQDLLDNTAASSVTLTLKKRNGQLKTTRLVKLKIESQENTVNGYILKSKTGNLGYISVPGFYTDMLNQDSPGCANDVAKEIIKLERDSIAGLIIDLRNNGGGSLLEAINLAGIFVDEGPLLITRQKDKKPSIIKDINRGSIFKKPIVVLINEMSASASELFCNIVKDYNLGVIVGQRSFGKGTAQSVMPLDTSVYRKAGGLQQSGDFIKLTLAMFYRLDCSSHQGVGVSPDIELPGTPGYSFIEESNEPYYLKADGISKKVIYTPKPAIGISVLQEKSKWRQDHSEAFKRYKIVADSLMIYITTPQRIVLTFDEYQRYRQFSGSLFDAFEKACKTEDVDIKCYNTGFDRKIAEADEPAREFNRKIRQSIESDLFIREAFYILNDLITLTK